MAQTMYKATNYIFQAFMRVPPVGPISNSSWVNLALPKVFIPF